MKLADAKYSIKGLHLSTLFVVTNESRLPNITPVEMWVLSLL